MRATWRNIAPYFLLFCFGALLALIFAPFNLWPLGFIGFAALFIYLSRAKTLRQSASAGFFFGYGHAIAGTYWIANSLLVDAARFGWLYPISVLGLSALMALWPTLFAVLYFKLRTPSPFSNWLRFMVLWVVVEYLRSMGMFGFPWNLLGTASLAMPPLAWLASVFGTYGLSLFLVAFFTLPAVIYLQRGWRCVPILTAIEMSAVVALMSYVPLGDLAAKQTSLRVRVVQANIPQVMKWTEQGAYEAERRYAALSTMPAQDGEKTVPPVIIWPETAVPIPLRPNAVWPSQVGSLSPKNGTILTGALRVDGTDKNIQLYNSLIAITHRGAVQAIYDKHQLVPFGEFVPLRSVLPLEKITPGSLDFSRGSGVTTIDLGDGIPAFSPLVCYEVIFPWNVAGRAHRPQWIVNITNDGWYGNSPGPYQHLAAARMRAIEQGLPVVRAANTGISVVIDPYGRLQRALPLNARGVIDATLPSALPPTFYARFGELQVLLLMLLAMIGSLFTRRATPQSSPAPARSDTHPSA